MKKVAVMLALAMATGTAFAQSGASPATTTPTARTASDASAHEQLLAANSSTVAPRESTPRLAPREHHGRAVLPTGTAIYLRIEQSISTRSNQPGDTFLAQVAKPVIVGGLTVIPAGTSVSGTVLSTEEPRRIAGHSSIGLRPDSIILPNGSSMNINGVVVDTTDPRRYRVDSEGRIKGPGKKNLDRAEGVALSGTGAIAGAIIAGPGGMLVGAATGLATTGGHMLLKRHEMILPAGTQIIVELSGPATLAAPDHSGE